LGKVIGKRQPFWLLILRRKGPLLFNNFVIFGQSKKYFQKMLGFNYEIRNFKYVDGEVSIDINEAERLKDLVEKQITKKTKFFGDFINKCSQQCNRLLKLSKQIAQIKNLKQLKNDELREWFEKYAEEVLKMMPFLNIISIMERIFEEKIREGLEEKLSRKGEADLLDSFLRALIFPQQNNFVIQQLDELVRIAADIQKRPKLAQKFKSEAEDVEMWLKRNEIALYSKLKRHVKKFGFLNMYCYEGQPMKIKDVILRLQELLKEDCRKKLTEIISRKREDLERFREIITKYEIGGRLREFIDYAQEYLYFRLYRLDILFMAGYLVRDFIEEIGKKMNLSYDEVIYVWHKEVLDFLKKGIIPDREEVKKREKAYATILIDGKLTIFSGKKALALPPKKKIKRTKKLTGRTASLGKHQGKVKIVLSSKEIDKVKKGNVLVSIMTNPYYVPAMIRAGAIVTDEGGILCHAAIVSREFGKPCIVGTKIATQVLKDGDLVEVDASRGLVKRIK